MTRTQVNIPSVESNVMEKPMSLCCRCPGDTKSGRAQLRLVAAIAAFQTNNTRRTRVLGQVANDAKVMPVITLVSSSPTFYKIPITKELAQEQFSATQIVMYSHLPAVPRLPVHFFFLQVSMVWVESRHTPDAVEPTIR